MRFIAPLCCFALLWVAGCESSTQSTRTILNAGRGPGNEIKDGSDLDFTLQSTQREFPKERWIRHYRYLFAHSDAVVLVKIDSQNAAICTDVWKAKDGLPRIGDQVPTLAPRGDPDMKERALLIVWFSPYPSKFPRAMNWVKDGLVQGDLTVAEVRNAVLTDTANKPAQITTGLRPAVSDR